MWAQNLGVKKIQHILCGCEYACICLFLHNVQLSTVIQTSVPLYTKINEKCQKKEAVQPDIAAWMSVRTKEVEQNVLSK